MRCHISSYYSFYGAWFRNTGRCHGFISSHNNATAVSDVFLTVSSPEGIAMVYRAISAVNVIVKIFENHIWEAHNNSTRKFIWNWDLQFSVPCYAWA